MSGVIRFTVSVPGELLEAAEKKLAPGEHNRSAFIRRLLEAALRDAQEREDVAQWIRGYQEQPQTEEEFGWQDEIAKEYLAQERWE